MLDITRLSGAIIYVGLGQEYSKDLHVFEYENDLTNSPDSRDPASTK
jgi:hypothetical protein